MTFVQVATNQRYQWTTIYLCAKLLMDQRLLKYAVKVKGINDKSNYAFPPLDSQIGSDVKVIDSTEDNEQLISTTTTHHSMYIINIDWSTVYSILRSIFPRLPTNYSIFSIYLLHTFPLKYSILPNWHQYQPQL